MTQEHGFTRAMIAGCALAAAVLLGADARPLDAATRLFEVHAIARGSTRSMRVSIPAASQR